MDLNLRISCKDTKNNSLLFDLLCTCTRVGDLALLVLPFGLGCALAAKPNVPNAGRHKIELKNVRWEE